MTKLTDNDYFLPTIQALIGHSSFSSGTTQPMLIRGVCTATGKKDDYVVKYRRSPRMSKESSCRELIAVFIAMELDLFVAEPAIIDVGEEFVETLTGIDGYKYAANSIGLNFGCKYVSSSSHVEFVRNQRLNQKQKQEAVRIFAFDVLVSNPDRRRNNQNMLTDGDRILIFDHELAFSFILDLKQNKRPWILNAIDISWIKDHYFYPFLKGSHYDFKFFVEIFERLDDNFWEKVFKSIPQQWANDQIYRIRTTLEQIVYNRVIFLDELNRVLS